MSYEIIDGNIVTFKGNTLVVPFTFNIDLTGLTLILSAKKTLSDTSYILQSINSTHDDAVNGITHLSLSHTQTNIAAGEYPIDINLIKYDTDGTTILEQNTIFPTIENKEANLIILDQP